MDKREKSRQDWEQELVRRQQNITPADYPEGLHYVKAKGLPRIVSQVRFWGGIVLLAVGVSIFRSDVTIAVVVAALTIAGGLCLSITAMRWRDDADRRAS